MTLTALGYAFIGGLLPSLIWLHFLLKEDARHPEPKRLIALAFVAGMMMVPFALPLERLVQGAYLPASSVLIGWAIIEEVLKYLAAAGLILWRGAVDEAPDYVIYLLTVALGFAAIENAFFLLTPLSAGRFAAGFFTGDLRFLGATLVHVVASSAIGFALAFSFGASRATRFGAAALGLILAVALHAAFNALIIGRGGATELVAFSLVWMAAVIFFAAFEVLKFLRPSAARVSNPS